MERPYDKAMDIANIPSFPRAIFMNEKYFPKALDSSMGSATPGPIAFIK